MKINTVLFSIILTAFSLINIQSAISKTTVVESTKKSKKDNKKNISDGKETTKQSPKDTEPTKKSDVKPANKSKNSSKSGVKKNNSNKKQPKTIANSPKSSKNQKKPEKTDQPATNTKKENKNKTSNRAKVEYPKLKKFVAAKYPKSAIDKGIEGVVIIKITIEKTGDVSEAVVVKPLSPDLDTAAVDAVKQFKFIPAKLNGKPIKVKIPIKYPFKLKNKSVSTKKPNKVNKKPTISSKKVKITKTVVKIKNKPQKSLIKDLTQGLRGVLREKGGNKSLEYTEVRLFNIETDKKEKIASRYTDEKGRVFFPGLKYGKYLIEVNAPGCYQFKKKINYTKNSKPFKYYIERYAEDPNNIIVIGLKKRKTVTKYTVTLEEIINIPGTQGDALKGIQNMPGIARAPFNLGFLIVRGAAPEDTRIMFEGHEIPLLYHFLGITSVFNSDLLKSIDFIPGNFSVKYGRAMGGIIDVKTRIPKKDAWHGYIDSDIWDTGALIQGPVGKGSIAFSLRRSYIDAILRQIPDVGIAPVYYDYQSVFSYPIFGGKFKFLFFGSDDQLKLLDAGTTPYITHFDKGIALYKKIVGKNSFNASIAFGRTKVDIGQPGGENRITQKVYRTSWRLSYIRKFNKNLKVEIGAPGEFWDVDIKFKTQLSLDPNSDSNISFEKTVANLNIKNIYQAFYVEPQLKFGKLTIVPGIRGDFFHNDFASGFTFDPRISSKYEIIKKKLIVSGGIGVFHQNPSIDKYSPDWYGNPKLGYESALHTSIGTEYRPRKSLSIKVVGFYKHLWDLVATTEDQVMRDGELVNENVDNSGRGRIYGAEFLLKKTSSSMCPPYLGMQKCFGWISYTLMKSERRDTINTNWYLFEFDQTHILTAIFSGKWKGNWRLGFRFRLTTGNPTTPIIGAVYDADQSRYTPIQGSLNSGRLPMFHQLDVRLDKKFVFNKFSINLYLDVQNVYNYQTSEFMIYNFNYTKKTTVPGLPIVPSLGIKGIW